MAQKKKIPANEAAAVYVDPGTLTPWDQNPRNNEQAIGEVAKSIERFGFASPIIARTRDGRIIAGHTRLQAALRLGLDTVPVRFLDLDDQAASALALADNKLGEVATWEHSVLADILIDLETQGADLSGLGWDEEELESILRPGEYEPKNGGELDLGDFSEFDHECPRCGFEWTDPDE